MSNFGRVATLMLAVMPLIASAQTDQQPKPAPQAGAPAPAQSTASPATQAAKAPPAANSQRFVTSDNFYRPAAKPQPGVPAPSAAIPASVTSTAKPSPAIKPNSMPVPPRATAPQVAPVAASMPEVHASQPAPAPIQPTMATNPNPASPPATSAAVDYVSGKLTVVADNAPLGLVLKLIAAKTGAVVDLVPELQNEPVVARLGPSPVREVLTALLDSPRIDYIVLGEGDEGGKLQRIVVRMRHSFALFAANPRQPQPKREAPQEEGRLDQNGQPISNAPGTVDPEIAQQQRMANWQKTREAMRMAEIKQQAQERENEKNNPSFPDPPPPPQDQPPDPPQNPPQENPPQR